MLRKSLVIAVSILVAAGATKLVASHLPFLRLQMATSTPTQKVEGEQLFTKSIKPILDNECSRCHGAGRVRSGLVVTSRESLLCGGHRGPAIIPGQPDQSLLILSIRQTGELKMPPRRAKLSPDEIEAIELWVKDGAPWPRDKTWAWGDQVEGFVNCIL